MEQEQNFEAPQVRGYDKVIDFFSNIGARREAGMYVKMFRDVVPWRFAVVLISADQLESSVREVALDLAYLSGMNEEVWIIAKAELPGSSGSQHCRSVRSVFSASSGRPRAHPSSRGSAAAPSFGFGQ